MSAVTQGLVPTTRDFDIFERVAIDQRTTRAVAQAAGVSQSRVCQIVDKVRAFLKGELPSGDAEQQKRELAVAQHVASARINHMYGQCLRQWEVSIGAMQLTVQETSGGIGPKRTVRTQRQSFGEHKFLTQALRFAEHASKLPLRQLAFSGAGDFADEPAEPAIEASPVGGYSDAAREMEVATSAVMTAPIATIAENEICDEHAEPASEPKSDEWGPIQNEEANHNEVEIQNEEAAEFPFPLPMTEEPLVAVSVATNDNHLTTQQRRKRRTFLQQRLHEYRRT